MAHSGITTLSPKCVSKKNARNKFLYWPSIQLVHIISRLSVVCLDYDYFSTTFSRSMNKIEICYHNIVSLIKYRLKLHLFFNLYISNIWWNVSNWSCNVPPPPPPPPPPNEEGDLTPLHTIKYSPKSWHVIIDFLLHPNSHKYYLNAISFHVFCVFIYLFIF